MHPMDRREFLAVAAAAAAPPVALRWQTGQGAEVNGSPASFGFVMAPAASIGEAQTGPVFRTGPSVSPPSVLQITPAWYPNAARDAGVGGLVIITGVVRETGALVDLKVSESAQTPFGLDRALSAVRQWTFSPGLSNGKKVAVEVMCGVEFGPLQSSQPATTTGWAAGPRGGPGVVSPTLRTRVEPLYLPGALRARVTGEVVVEMLVAVDGRVTASRVTKSLDTTFGMDEVALQTARRWTFNPAMASGQPVPMVVSVVLEFKLH
jgi:TonB family protein